MIPPRYLGLGAAIFLVRCGSTPPPIVNVTVVMPAQPEPAKVKKPLPVGFEAVLQDLLEREAQLAAQGSGAAATATAAG